MSFADIGEGAVIPNWVTKIIGGGETIDPETVAFFKKSKTSFYAWHWYGTVKTPEKAIENAALRKRELSLKEYERKKAKAEGKTDSKHNPMAPTPSSSYKPSRPDCSGGG